MTEAESGGIAALSSDEDPAVGGKSSARGAFAYLAVASLQRGVAFLTLPLFAAALTPAEFGRITVLLSVFGLAAVVLPAGLETAVFRGAFGNDPAPVRERRLRTLTTVLFIGPIGAALLVGLTLAQRPSMFGLEPQELGAYVVAAGLLTAATIAPLAVLRAREAFRSYAVLALGIALTQTALRVLFVVVLDEGVRGWVLADLLASVAALLLSLRWQARLLTLRRGSHADLREGLRIGLPLVPHMAAHWGLGLSDRIVLAAFTTASLVGVYGVGYQIAFVAGLAVTELSRAYAPRYGEAVGDTRARAELSRHAQQQALATLGVTAIVALLGPQAVHLLLPEAYGGAARYIPWVVLGYAFLGLYYLPMNVLSIVAGKTNGIWLCTVAAAVVNIVANLALVPVFGPMAAAVNTAVGYLVLLALVSILARRRCPDVTIDLRRIRAGAICSSIIAATGSVVAVRSGPTGLVTALASVAAVLLVLAWTYRRTSTPMTVKDAER